MSTLLSLAISFTVTCSRKHQILVHTSSICIHDRLITRSDLRTIHSLYQSRRFKSEFIPMKDPGALGSRGIEPVEAPRPESSPHPKPAPIFAALCAPCSA